MNETKKFDAKTVRYTLAALSGYGVFATLQKGFGPVAKNANIFAWLGVTLFDISMGIYGAGLTSKVLSIFEEAIVLANNKEVDDGGSED